MGFGFFKMGIGAAIGTIIISHCYVAFYALS
jgi:hypothetical protein